jgi:hypothetical protein
MQWKHPTSNHCTSGSKVNRKNESAVVAYVGYVISFNCGTQLPETEGLVMDNKNARERKLAMRFIFQDVSGSLTH